MLSSNTSSSLGLNPNNEMPAQISPRLAQHGGDLTRCHPKRPEGANFFSCEEWLQTSSIKAREQRENAFTLWPKRTLRTPTFPSSSGAADDPAAGPKTNWDLPTSVSLL